MADGPAAPAAGNRPSNPTQATQPTGSPADLPDGWFAGDPTVVVDREEITVIGRLKEPEGADGTESEAHASGRVARFREETRPERMRIADEAEARYGRKVAWGVEIGAVGDDTYERILFTHIAVPVMTRLQATRTSGARHPGRRRGGAVTLGCARVVGPARRRARR